MREMRARRLAPEKVHAVALSHAHPDHMGGITTFLTISQPTVIISEIDAPFARNPQLLNDSFDITLGSRHYPEFGFGEAGLNLLDYFKTLSKCPMASVKPDKTMKEGHRLKRTRPKIRLVSFGIIFLCHAKSTRLQEARVLRLRREAPRRA
ncbi:MAG: MBL fold metallo-hydrolase [Candidatus Freyarchaeota archaeon]